MMVCYDRYADEIDSSITSYEECEAADFNWIQALQPVKEGEDGDHSDHEDHGDSDEERVWYITNEMDFHFEGDMSDYSIVLALCDEDINWDTGETIKECSTHMTVSMNDAMLETSSVMFHDTDSSGTISDGDMIHVSDSSDDWDEVRLYSTSADAYSDENPMHDAPGFTGLVGMLALLGAAFIRRND